jgi:hypothetical protein
MGSDNSRFQHLQSQIDALRKQIQRPDKHIAEQPEKKDTWGRWNTLAVSVFTGLLVLTSYMQWDATRGALDDTHKSFEIGTRAWITPKTANIKPTKSDRPNHVIVQEGNGIKDSRTPAISVELVNAGHSPALDVSGIFRCEVLDRLPIDDYIFPPTPKDQVASKNIVGPDVTFANNSGVLLSEPQFEAVAQGKQFLAVYGEITYDDIFKSPHKTRYCYFYDYITEKMAFCPHFNSTN